MRPRDFILVDVIFISIQGPSYSDCQFHRVFAVNISVGLMTRQHQNPTAVSEGLTPAFFHPQLMEVTVMWQRQVTGVDWQVYLAAVSGWGGGGWSSGWQDVPLRGQREMVIRTFLMVVWGCLRSSSLLPIQPVMAPGPPARASSPPWDTSII